MIERTMYFEPLGFDFTEKGKPGVRERYSVAGQDIYDTSNEVEMDTHKENRSYGTAEHHKDGTGASAYWSAEIDDTPIMAKTQEELVESINELLIRQAREGREQRHAQAQEGRGAGDGVPLPRRENPRRQARTQEKERRVQAKGLAAVELIPH